MTFDPLVHKTNDDNSNHNPFSDDEVKENNINKTGQVASLNILKG